jgi:autotransporter-associated beta strand protein
MVCLESRTVPATLLWTGDVDAHWGTNQFGNTNWAFDVLPHNGDSLVFPASSQNHSNTNNLTGLIINNLTIQYNAAVFDGNSITLTGNFVHSNSSPGSNDIFLPITLSPGTHTFTISPSPGSAAVFDFFQRFSESGGVASLVKDGDGELGFGSANSYTGVTTVNAGALNLSNTSGVSISGDLVINRGRVVEFHAGGLIADTSAVTINSGGSLELDGHFDRIGSLHVAGGGLLRLDGSDQGLLHANSVTFDDGAILSMVVGRTGFTPDDAIVSFGPVRVGGTLNLTIEADDAIGTQLELIANAGNGPITGVFDNLPRGGIYDFEGHLFTINYAGGIGGNDLFLVRRANVNVTSTRINDGAAQRSRVTSLTLTFSDPVDFSITPGTAFNLVRNSDGAFVTFDATATLVNGVTVVTLDNFSGNATQFGSLADGRYTLTALASQISFDDEPLDGNGDGTAGDNFTLNDAGGLFCMFGDVNGDRTVNGLDFGFFRNAFSTSIGDPNYLSFLDLNGDGVINGFDLGQFRTRFGTTLP